MPHERMITSHATRQEEVVDRAIRPTSLDDYIGQPKVRHSKNIFNVSVHDKNHSSDLLCFSFRCKNNTLSSIFLLCLDGFVAQINFELGFSLTPYLSRNTLCRWRTQMSETV